MDTFLTTKCNMINENKLIHVVLHALPEPLGQLLLHGGLVLLTSLGDLFHHLVIVSRMQHQCQNPRSRCHALSYLPLLLQQFVHLQPLADPLQINL